MNKLDSYLHQEAERQFPTQKREEIYLQRLAKIKGENTAKCEWCGELTLIKDSRQKIKLCKKCESGRPVITYYLDSHKLEHLRPSDIDNIKASKTVRLGSGKAFNK